MITLSQDAAVLALIVTTIIGVLAFGCGYLFGKQD